MIQYQYFNNNRGGEDRLSVSMEAPEYAYLEGLFRKLRSLAQGTGFTYATLSSGKSVFMQTTGDGVGFAKGLLVDRMNEFPCKFIGKFEKEMDNLDSVGHKLPDGELPAISRRSPEFPSDRAIHRAVPRIIDALLCADPARKLLIVTAGQSESEKIMQAISAILPKKLMTGIGFSIGTQSVDPADISIKNPNGKSDTASIRIWLPELSDFKIGNYSSNFYVFDVNNEVDNYGDNAGTLAKVLEEMNLCDVDDVRDFIGFIGDAFTDNGGVNKEMLEGLCTDYLLQMKKDPAVAKEILKGRDPSNPKDKLSIISAISVITDPANERNITADDLDLILSICRENKEIRRSSSASVMEFIANSRSFYTGLSADSKAVCTAMIADDDQGEILNSLYNNWWMTCRSASERDEVSVELFGMTCDTIKNIFKSTGRPQAMTIKHITNKAVHFFNVDLNRAISAKCAQEVFSTALEYKDKSVRDFAVCILMASGYLPGVDKKYVRTLIEKLRNALHSSSAKEQIGLIFNFRKTLVQIAEEDRELGLEGYDNFPFSCDLGNEWCDSLIGVKKDIRNPISDSIMDLLRLRSEAVASRYSGMIAVTEKLLFNSTYVSEKLVPEVVDDYERFIDSRSDHPKYNELSSLVSEIKVQSSTDVMNKDIIFDNMIEKFSFLSEDDQKKILSKVDARTDDFKSFSNEEKRRFTQELSEYPRLERVGRIATSIVIDYNFLLTAAFPIISAILLIIPALFMVMFSSIDVSLAERLNGYMNSLLMVAIPIGELVLLSLMYHFTKNAGKKLSRTVKIGVLYNIPIAIYDIIILILFYTGYSINSLF